MPPPFTKESLLYREIFESFYPGQSHMVKDFWMPNKNWEGCNVTDPSARVLSNYGASGDLIKFSRHKRGCCFLMNFMILQHPHSIERGGNAMKKRLCPRSFLCSLSVLRFGNRGLRGSQAGNGYPEG